jgi:hypothetical protein
VKLPRFTVVTRQWADAVYSVTTLLDLLPSLITALIYVLTPLEELARVADKELL